MMLFIKVDGLCEETDADKGDEKDTICCKASDEAKKYDCEALGGTCEEETGNVPCWVHLVA